MGVGAWLNIERFAIGFDPSHNVCNFTVRIFHTNRSSTLGYRALLSCSWYWYVWQIRPYSAHSAGSCYPSQMNIDWEPTWTLKPRQAPNLESIFIPSDRSYSCVPDMVVTCPRNTSTYNVRITTFMVHFVHFDINKFIRRLSDRSVFVRLRRLQSIISAITCLMLTVLCVWMVLCSQLDCYVAQQSPYGCSTSSCEIETPLFRCSYSVVFA